MNYEVLKELRDERRKRHTERGGKINPTPQYRKPHREGVGEEPKRNQNVFLPSEEIKVDKRGSVKEVEFAFQKNPCLDGHPREKGLEDCVLKNAAVTSNKSEIARQCSCSPRTVFRILVEEKKQEDVIDVEGTFCEQCGEVFVGYEDEEGAVVCSNCGWERE